MEESQRTAAAFEIENGVTELLHSLKRSGRFVHHESNQNPELQLPQIQAAIAEAITQPSASSEELHDLANEIQQKKEELENVLKELAAAQDSVHSIRQEVANHRDIALAEEEHVRDAEVVLTQLLEQVCIQG